MATHDYIISNASGAAVRADLNNALAAIATNNSSATEPTTTYAYQWWADTGSSPTVMKLRNAANSGWITLFQLDGEWTVVPFENGTAAAPSIYFKDSGTDTGIYSPGTDQVAITTGGTARLYVGSTGAVGIGSNSPINKLVVSDSGNGGFEVAPGATDIQTYSYNRGTSAYITHTDLASAFIWNNGTAERARIDSSGRWLLGTSTARSNFYNSTVTAQHQLEGTDSEKSAIAAIHVGANVGGPRVILAKGRGGSIGSNTAVQNGDTLGQISFQGNDGTEFVEAAIIEAYVDATPGANDMPGRLVFSTTADGASSPTERMRITNAGRVLIGDATGGSGSFQVKTSVTNEPIGQIYATNAAFNNDVLTLSADRNTTSNAYNFLQCVRQGAAVVLFIRDSGNVQNANNSYTAISDIKLKENIVDANSQWADIKALRVRNYNFKEETGQSTHRQIGLVAQELETVCPHLVDESPDRDFEGNDLGTVTKGVNYSVLYMKAVKALQEAMERIETLEAKVAALESA